MATSLVMRRGSAAPAGARRPRAVAPPVRSARPRPGAAARGRGPTLLRSSPEHSEWSAAGPQDAGEDPAAALATCIGHIEAGDLDSLLEFVPDEVIDRVIEMRRCNISGGEPSWLRFTDVLQANASSHLYLDSFAVRHLTAPPRAVRRLSAVRVSGDRYLQRCEVVSESGEEAVLSFEMLQQECLENQYRGPPLVRKRWMLRSVRGESGDDAAPLPAHPSPTYAPEAVLQAQLAALREHSYVDVFAHASPSNREATGPVQHFARMLRSPAFAPLLGHEGSEMLQRLQPSPTVFMELVRVYPGGAAKARLAAEAAGGRRNSGGGGARPGLTYLWVLSRQGEGTPFPGCWMVDSVQPIDALAPPPPGAAAAGGGDE
ncbi:MAG: hypothetical protein J3K34DRAFT_425570 [Monoraphidium minutum]|nr:MAG: hypothetical protein J3K34DRAFT_425570 [Monoraphidium minutum]